MDFIEHSKPTIGKPERQAVIEVMNSNYLAEGDAVERFEHELSSYIGSRGGVAASTGTLALHLALLSLGIDGGGEVITPSYVCRSVLNAIVYAGAKPVICDVERGDFNISFGAAVKAITRNTKAIIVPHMFGCPAKVDKFRDLGIPIIEDCAHSIGAEYKDKKVGSWGDLSVFSFEGTKYIVSGEGGMVLANRASLLKKLRELKEPDSPGYKAKYTYRMTDLQAAVGRAQLARISSFIKKRRKIARFYTGNFSGLGIDLPFAPEGCLHVFHRYMIKMDKGIHGFMKRCYSQGIKVKQPVKPHPLHKYLCLPGNKFPNTEYIMKHAVSIPIYPLLTGRDLKHIVKIVRAEIAD